jgi:tRNA(adenine34) deaminase
MCAGAVFWSQIGRIVFGAYDEKRGYTVVEPGLLHPSTNVIGGVMESECSSLVKEFFKKKRNS